MKTLLFSEWPFNLSSADDGIASVTSASELPASSTTSPRLHIVTPDATSGDLPTDLGDTSEDDVGKYMFMLANSLWFVSYPRQGIRHAPPFGQKFQKASNLNWKLSPNFVLGPPLTKSPLLPTLSPLQQRMVTTLYHLLNLRGLHIQCTFVMSLCLYPNKTLLSMIFDLYVVACIGFFITSHIFWSETDSSSENGIKYHTCILQGSHSTWKTLKY